MNLNAKALTIIGASIGLIATMASAVSELIAKKEENQEVEEMVCKMIHEELKSYNDAPDEYFEKPCSRKKKRISKKVRNIGIVATISAAVLAVLADRIDDKAIDLRIEDAIRAAGGLK